MRLSSSAAFLLTVALAAPYVVVAQDEPFSTPSEARAWLAKKQIVAEPGSLGFYLMESSENSLFAVRALLLVGVSPKLPTLDDRLYPLTVLTRSCQGAERAQQMAEALLDAGADPNQKEKADGGITPLMQAVGCPDVFAALIRRKPDLNVTDDKGWTVAHHAFMAVDPPRELPLWLLAGNGFDYKRWRASLAKAFPTNDDRELLDKLVAGLPK